MNANKSSPATRKSNNKKNISNRSSHKQIDSFLKKLDETTNLSPADKNGRLIFAMDATASRQPSWDRACQIQGQMFSETSSLGGLSIQLCYYRGFNEFQAYPWQSSSASLLKSMSSVFCLGGYTQIIQVLQHTIEESRQHKIDALIFIGDAMEEDIDQLHKLAGELGLLGIPIFIFHEGNDRVAGQAFQQLSRLSKGAYCRFNSNSAEQLRDLLSAVAVYAVGGYKALSDFSRNKGGIIKQLNHQINNK